MERILLQGLNKLRDLGNIESVSRRVKEIRMLRSQKDKDLMRSFVQYGLRHMISINAWNASKENVRISHIFSIHDEAFAILLIMNNWTVWEKMALGHKRSIGENSGTLYTNKVIKKNEKVSTVVRGWSNQGLKEFNVILKYLVTVRNKVEIKQVENMLKEEYKENNEKRLRKRKRQNQDENLIAEREVPLDAYSLEFSQE